jgi:hypothetical protein
MRAVVPSLNLTTNTTGLACFDISHDALPSRRISKFAALGKLSQIGAARSSGPEERHRFRWGLFDATRPGALRDLALLGCSPTLGILTNHLYGLAEFNL